MNCRVLKDIVIYNSLLCSLKTTNLNKNCTNVTYTSLNICIELTITVTALFKIICKIYASTKKCLVKISR